MAKPFCYCNLFLSSAAYSEMTNADLKQANEIARLLSRHAELKDHIQFQLGAAKAGTMPDMSEILNSAHLLNVVTPKMMVPVLEEYTALAKTARDELEAELKAL